jgi:uncharacterized protein YutE (UPF0331/DUF86 family)
VRRAYGQGVAGMNIDKERINNSLIHRYWIISDSKSLSLVRKNSSDFDAFIQAIQTYASTQAV